MVGVSEGFSDLGGLREAAVEQDDDLTVPFVEDGGSWMFPFGSKVRNAVICTPSSSSNVYMSETNLRASDDAGCTKRRHSDSS